MYTVLKTSSLNQSSVQFIPGQRLPVNRHDEIQELSSRTNRTDMSSIQIFQIVKGFLEEYLGSTDQLFRNATNAGGGKTLGEIKAGIQLSMNLLSVELMLWNDSLKKVYQMVWDILRDGLLKPFSVGGELITKEDFNFDAEINPTGTIEALDKVERLNRSLQRFNIILQQVQLGVIANKEDLYNAMYDYLIEDGCKNPGRYITEPRIIDQQNAEASMAKQEYLKQQENEMLAESLAIQRQAGVPPEQMKK
jgi:hypothetical protein